MGLAETLQSAALAAHKAVGNVNETVVYHSTGTLTYNPATGANAEADDEDYTLERAIFTEYRVAEIDGEKIQANDLKMLVPASDVSFTPKTTDYVTRADGTKWQVMNKRTDPASAEWIIQLRR